MIRLGFEEVMVVGQGKDKWHGFPIEGDDQKLQQRLNCDGFRRTGQGEVKV